MLKDAFHNLYKKVAESSATFLILRQSREVRNLAFSNPVPKSLLALSNFLLRYVISFFAIPFIHFLVFREFGRLCGAGFLPNFLQEY